MFDGTLESITLDPFGGWPLYVLLLAGALGLGAWAYLSTPAPLSTIRRAVLWGCRALALAILVTMLARPVAVIARGYDGKPIVALLVDTSASMNRNDESGGVTRSARAIEAADGLAAALGDRFEITLRGFDSRLRPPAVDPSSLAPDSSRASAPGDALDDLLREERSAPLAAVVLFTDGAATHGRDLLSQARQISAPLFAAWVGDSVPPADVQIVRVDAPPAGFVGERVGVTVRLRTIGGDAATLRVKLQGDDEETGVFGEETVTLAGEGTIADVALQLRPDRPGRRFYRVVLDGAPAGSSVNDTIRFALDVRKDRLQVLTLDEHLSWDLAFLRRTLERDTTLSYTHLVRSGTTDVAALGDRRVERFPRDLGSLSAFKAIVMGDLSPEFLSRAELEVIAQFVEAGGGLLLFGGNRAGGIARFAGTPIERVSPLATEPPPTRGPGSFSAPPLGAEVTVLGDAHPLVTLHGDAYFNRELWRDLPPLRPAAAPLSARAGSQVLVELDSGDRRFPLITVSRAGAGRVVAFTGRAFWKWKFLREGLGGDDAFFDTFWVGVMRWLADPEPASRIRIQPERLVFRHGDEVVLSGRALGPDLVPLTDADISVTLSSGRDTVRVTPRWREGGAVTFRAGSLPSRRWGYDIEVRQGDAPALRQEGVLHVGANGPEWWDLASRPDLLRWAAAATGGRAVGAADVLSLADAIALPDVHATTKHEARLWNHPLPFLIFLLAVGVEWWMRRRAGLA